MSSPEMSAAPTSAPKEPLSAHVEGSNAPDWEIPKDGTSKPTRLHLGKTTTRWAIADRFDRILPPHKRYLGRSRRTFLIVLLALFVLLLALVIGLAVGLTKKSQYAYISLLLTNLLTHLARATSLYQMERRRLQET
jgi:hypothetical protein